MCLCICVCLCACVWLLSRDRQSDRRSESLVLLCYTVSVLYPLPFSLFCRFSNSNVVQSYYFSACFYYPYYVLVVAVATAAAAAAIVVVLVYFFVFGTATNFEMLLFFSF